VDDDEAKGRKGNCQKGKFRSTLHELLLNECILNLDYIHFKFKIGKLGGKNQSQSERP